MSTDRVFYELQHDTDKIQQQNVTSGDIRTVDLLGFNLIGLLIELTWHCL